MLEIEILDHDITAVGQLFVFRDQVCCVHVRERGWKGFVTDRALQDRVGIWADAKRDLVLFV